MGFYKKTVSAYEKRVVEARKSGRVIATFTDFERYGIAAMFAALCDNGGFFGTLENLAKTDDLDAVRNAADAFEYFGDLEIAALIRHGFLEFTYLKYVERRAHGLSKKLRKKAERLAEEIIEAEWERFDEQWDACDAWAVLDPVKKRIRGGGSLSRG
ncbi:MAG: hypothetical protein ACK5LO_10920 [Leucobacter sp.]